MRKLIIILSIWAISNPSLSAEILANRFLTSSILKEVYGNGPEVDQILENNILTHPNSFGGACSLMERVLTKTKNKTLDNSSPYYCRNGISESKTQIYSTDLKSRFALLKNACSELSTSGEALDYLSHSTRNHNNIREKTFFLIRKFYPHIKEDSPLISITLESVLKSEQLYLRFLNNYSLTRKFFLRINKQKILQKISNLLCLSEKWQSLSKSDLEERKYTKCHSIFTQRRPTDNSAVIEEIKSGKIDAVNACMNLLKSATLEDNSKGDHLINRPKDNELGVSVLRSFEAFHNTWFPNYMAYMADDSPLLYDLIELEEPALFLTRSLFSKNYNYSRILKGKSSLRGIRHSEFKSDFLITAGTDRDVPKKTSYRVNTSKEEHTTWSPPHLDKGSLIGISYHEKEEILPAHSNQLFFPVYNHTPVDIHKSIGGGILGSNSYIIFNNGRPHGELSDGKALMMRGYSQNVVRDLLCRDLPVIRPEDSVSYINKKSKLSWSQNKNCMSCHATMDTMAGLLRNAELIINDVNNEGSSHMKYHTATHSSPKESMLFDTIDSYHLTKAAGAFVYRDIEDNFIDTKVNSLDELGEEIAKTRDFYACAATRYFYFLTGKDISISSIKDLDDKELKSYLNHTIDGLQKNQDLQSLIKEIISSKWF